MCLEQHLGYFKEHIRIHYYICNYICPQNRSWPCWPSGFPGSSDGKEPASILKTWVKKIPLRREWLPTPVLFFFFDWRLIALQQCGGFSHTLMWISHGCTCVPPFWAPLPPTSPLHPSGLSQSTRLWVPCLMHLHWTGTAWRIPRTEEPGYL